MSKYFYAVRVGNAPGIYNTWAECKNQVKGFKGAKFKKFKSYKEALAFMEDREVSLSNKLEEEMDGKKESFMEKIDSKDEMIAYVDGSFSLEQMIYSYGVVTITKDGIESYRGKEDDPTLAKMRNVSGELKGAMEAMAIAIDKGYKKLYLHYDYAGIEKWAKGHWKTNRDGTRAYKKYYESISDSLDVEFIKVKAHEGIKYNEMADSLAKKAIEELI